MCSAPLRTAAQTPLHLWSTLKEVVEFLNYDVEHNNHEGMLLKILTRMSQPSLDTFELVRFLGLKPHPGPTSKNISLRKKCHGVCKFQ